MSFVNKIKKKWLKEDADFKEMVLKSASSFFIKISGFFIAYLFVLLISRFYGASSNGLYSLSMTILMIVTIFSRFGLDTSLVKYFASGLAEGNLNFAYKAYKISYRYSLIVSIVLSGILILISEWIALTIFSKESMIIPIRVMAFALPFWATTLINAAVLRGLKKTNAYSFYFQVGRYLIALICLVLFYYFIVDKNQNLPVLAFSMGCILLGITSKIHVNSALSGHNSLINKSDSIKVDFIEILKTSLPMLLTSSMIFIMGWMDTIILGIYKTEAEVGIFNVAIKLATLTSFTLTAVNAISAPKFAELYAANEMERFEKVVKNNTKMIFWSSLPILIIIFCFPRFLLSLFGSEFESGIQVLLILTFAQFINSFCGSVGYILQMTGREKVFQRILLIALLMNLVLNLIFVKSFGGAGVAWGSAASLIFWNITSVVYIKKTMRITTFITFR